MSEKLEDVIRAEAVVAKRFDLVDKDDEMRATIVCNSILKQMEQKLSWLTMPETHRL